MKISTLLCLAAVAALALTQAGCTATNLATKPVSTHVVHIAGSGKKLGLVQDPVTGQYSLGYQSVFVGVTTIPITTAQDTNGTIRFIEPDVVTSYEIAGKGGFFGSAGSTYTVAVGTQAVQTLLGGAHVPINGTYWTNQAANHTLAVPTTANAAVAVPIVPSAGK